MSGVGHCTRFTFLLTFLKNPSIILSGIFLVLVFVMETQCPEYIYFHEGVKEISVLFSGGKN